MKTLLILLTIYLASCAPTVTLRMDVICLPMEGGGANCSDVQTLNEWIAKKKAERNRMAF